MHAGAHRHTHLKSDFWVNCPFKTFSADFKGTEYSPEAMTEVCTHTGTLQRSKGHLSAKCVFMWIPIKHSYHPSAEKINATAFYMFFMAVTQVCTQTWVTAKAQLAITIFIVWFERVIMLKFSIRLAPYHRSALVSSLSAWRCWTQQRLGKAQWKICGFDHEDQAKGTVQPVPLQAVRGRQKRKHKTFPEDYWGIVGVS